MRLFKWALGLLIVTLLLTGSVVYGSRRLLANQMKPAVREFAAQMCEPQPCWHGIQVGGMTFKQAREILLADSQLELLDPIESIQCWNKMSALYTRGCFIAGKDEIVYLLTFYIEDSQLRVGDLLFLFGEPLAIRLCGRLAQDYLTAELYFSGNIRVMAIDERNPLETHMQPNLPVRRIDYGLAGYTSKENMWTGFTNLSDSPDC